MRVFFFLFLFPIGLIAQHASIFPQPQSVSFNSEVFVIQSAILTIENTSETQQLIDYFHQQFEKRLNIHLELSQDKNADIVLIKNAPNLSKEAYSLLISSNSIAVEFSHQNGLFYALESLLQLCDNTTEIRGVRIEDSPRFPYRGTHLDCSRHFFTVPEIESFLDQMAHLKLNTFHWHLTDDQGWRLEIKQFPKLTEIGAWRDSTLIGHFSSTPQIYSHQRTGGFYTQEDAKHIVAYASARGITVVPEIEMPGHARAALAAYPSLGCVGNQMPVPGMWGVFDDVFCTKLETIEFLKKILDEVLAIFPSQTIHIGGDEVPKSRWNACPNCQLVMKQHGLMDLHQLQSYFIQEMEGYLQSKGRKLMGWDEILEGGLAANAQVMSWRGSEGGIAAAKTQHQVVMTPTAFCYFDYYQSSHPSEPLAIGGFLPLEKVFRFDPLDGVEVSAQKFIIGGQANIWTEYIATINAVEYAAFPRLIAMSEVLWTKPQNRTTYPEFVGAIVQFAFPRLDQDSIRYSTAALDASLAIQSTKNGIRVQAEAPFSGIQSGLEIGKEQAITGSSIELMRTNQVQEIELRSTSTLSGKSLRTNSYRFKTHLLLGVPVQFSTPPSAKYNVHGDLGLTDGTCGSRPWKGDQWLGFENDTVKFIVQTPKKVVFSRLELGLLNDPGSWIYLPKKATIEISKNGRKWITINEQNIQSEQLILDRKIQTKWLRVTLINEKVIQQGKPGAGFVPWTFIDELILTKAPKK